MYFRSMSLLNSDVFQKYITFKFRCISEVNCDINSSLQNEILFIYFLRLLSCIHFSVTTGDKQLCESSEVVQLEPPGGYIGKHTLLDNGEFLSNCVWSVIVPQGQNVAVTLYSFQYGYQWKRSQVKGKWFISTL